MNIKTNRSHFQSQLSALKNSVTFNEKQYSETRIYKADDCRQQNSQNIPEDATVA